MNSIWSEKEGCCVQFIACKGCHKRGKQDQLIGAEIVCMENPSQGFQKGQVRPKRCFYFIFSILINSFLLNNSVNLESARDQYIHFFYLFAKLAYFFFIFFLISDIFSIQSI